MWDELQDVLAWPSWWRGVVGVEELAPGNAERVGSRYAVEWRSRIPYPVRFEFETEQVERPALMAGAASGDLVGSGRWRLFEDSGVTAVLYEWEVATTRRWMSALAPLASPLFARNHDTVMRWGGEGLARRLGARLVASG